MKPQDRTRAILLSKVEASLRMVLVVLADAMLENRETCWLAVETIAERSGLCERQVRELLNGAEERGILRRWNGEHKSRDIAIEWEALASASAPASSRGGARPAKTATQPAKTAGDTTGSLCHPNRQSLPPQPAKTATLTGKDCPRSGNGSGKEAGTEAGTPLPPTGGGRGGSDPLRTRPLVHADLRPPAPLHGAPPDPSHPGAHVPDLAYHCADARCGAEPCPACAARIAERAAQPNAFDRARDRADLKQLKRIADEAAAELHILGWNDLD